MPVPSGNALSQHLPCEVYPKQAIEVTQLFGELRKDGVLKNEIAIPTSESYLINPNYMEKYCRNGGGYITMANTHHIPISHSKRARVMEMFNNLRGN